MGVSICPKKKKKKREKQHGFTSSSCDHSASHQRRQFPSFSVLGSYELLLLLLSLLLLPKDSLGAGALENGEKRNTGEISPLSLSVKGPLSTP